MRPSYLADVQLKILEQHEELRARIRALQRNAVRVDLPWAQRILRILFLRFAAQFDAHLGFEERELAPRIRELGAWGPVKEAALRSEHREQRRRIEEVCSLLEEPTADPSFVFEQVSALADSLLADILAEERTLEQLALTEERGRNQMTG